MSALDLDGLGDVQLREERDFLLGSLDDLEAEHEAGDVDDQDYVALRESYTARAAAVLRALDARAVASEASRIGRAPTTSAVVRARSQAAQGGRRGRGTLIIVGAMVVFAALAGTLVMRTAGNRLPGDNVSGSTPTSPVAKLLAQAQSQFQSQHLLDAIRTYDQAIALDPGNPEALAYKGWLLRLAGHQGGDVALIDRGLVSIRAAEAARPSYPDAHFFAGETLLRDKNDAAGAITEFEQFLADHPPTDFVPMVQGELSAARGQLGPPSSAPPATSAP